MDEYYTQKGFPMKCHNIFDVDVPKPKGTGPLGLVNYHFNTKIGQQGESPSSNMCASARGLAKLGAFMANKGTFNGK